MLFLRIARFSVADLNLQSRNNFRNNVGSRLLGNVCSQNNYCLWLTSAHYGRRTENNGRFSTPSFFFLYSPLRFSHPVLPFHACLPISVLLSSVCLCLPSCLIFILSTEKWKPMGHFWTFRIYEPAGALSIIFVTKSWRKNVSDALGLHSHLIISLHAVSKLHNVVEQLGYRWRRRKALKSATHCAIYNVNSP